ncbi:MAG: hypothetical protein QG656_2178 [Candidatus Hydrogenedentes bacterium]|nr:hypothetical protein [Candidatus Hydrogenedentota bacterium]
MTYAVYSAFYVGVLLYVLASMASLRYLYGRSDALTAVKALAAGGAALLLTTLAIRWAAWGQVPLTTMTDALNLFVLWGTLIVLFESRRTSMRALAGVCLPPLTVICLVSAATAHQYLSVAPRALNGVPLAVHVGSVFLAYALFFVASMTSGCYAFQAQRLKRLKTTGLFQRLPSLEQLDQTLYRLIGIGYPLFVATLAMGLAWAWHDRDLLGPHWWLSPKVMLSCGMAVFYAAVFHGRRRGLLRGPKLAYLFFWVFSAFLVTFLVLGVLHLTNYNFWGSAA